MGAVKSTYPPTSFSSVTFANLRIDLSELKLSEFYFEPFCHIGVKCQCST